MPRKHAKKSWGYIKLDKYPRVEEVILTQVLRGKGIEDDPVRLVTKVHHLDGTFIAEQDTWDSETGELKSVAIAEGGR